MRLQPPSGKPSGHPRVLSYGNLSSASKFQLLTDPIKKKIQYILQFIRKSKEKESTKTMKERLGDLRKTTGLIVEATSIISIVILLSYECAAWPIQS